MVREIDFTSEREISDLVADTVRDAAEVALDNLAELGLAIYGAGIVNDERRREFADEAARGREAVRDAARDLVDTLAATGERWGVEHDGCERLQGECGDALYAIAAKLGQITDEAERGWLYGRDLVRTLASLTRAIDDIAESVTRERDASGGDKAVREIPVYLANVPVELAGMVAL